MPLRWRGQTRSIAFTHTDNSTRNVLRSDSVQLCGFVPMVGQEGERSGHIDPDGQVILHWDEDQPIDPAALQGTLDQPKTAVWSSVWVGGEDPFDAIWLRLTSTEPGTCRIAATPTAVKAGLCTTAIPVRSPALVDGASLAYLTLRRLEPDSTAASRWELGATGHGPTGRQLADRLCDQIRAWDEARAAQPVVTAYRASKANDDLPSQSAIHKLSTYLTVSF